MVEFTLLSKLQHNPVHELLPHLVYILFLPAAAKVLRSFPGSLYPSNNHLLRSYYLIKFPEVCNLITMSIGTSPDVGNLLKTTFYASTADSLTTHFIEETSEGCSIKSVLPENLTEVLMRTATFHCGSCIYCSSLGEPHKNLFYGIPNIFC